MKFIGSLSVSVIVLTAFSLYGQVEVPRFATATSNDAITGSATLAKTGAGTLWLTSPSGNTFSGDISVGVDGGTLRIGGNPLYTAGAELQGATLPGMTAANTITVKSGGTFYIQDNWSTTLGYLSDRLGSSGNRPDVSLEGGSFTVNGPNAAVQTTQSVGQVSLASGASVISVARNHASATTQLIADSLSLTPGAYAQFAGTTLGSAAANVAQIYFTTPPTSVGGGGAAGTTTMSIVSGTRYGNDFVTYGDYGIRALTGSEYKLGNDLNGAGATENVKIGTAAAVTPLSGPKIVNSLVVTAGTSPWVMGNAMTLTSGQLLTLPTLTISTGTLTAGTGGDTDLDIITGGALTLGANIVDNGSGKIKLVKNSASTLTLSATTDNTYSGGTVVNEGTLLTSGTVADRRFFGSGPVKVDNAVLTLSAIGSTANATGDDYTTVNAAQISIANLAYTADDTFNIEAGSVISGLSAAGTGLNSLERGVNITLAPDAVVAHTSISTTFDPTINTIKNLGTAADLFYGLNGTQNSASGHFTVGSGTPFKGISTDRSGFRYWYLGTLSVATGTDDIYFQGLPLPGIAPITLVLGNNTLDGGPVVNLNGNGAVNAHLLGYVTLDDDQAVYGDTSVGDVLNFVVDSGSQLTANRADSMGSGTGIATATVKNGGTMTTLNTPANNTWAALNGDVTVEAGGRLVMLSSLGLTGAGALDFKAGSILDIQTADGFSGSQAAAATVDPGTIIRLTANAGSASDPLDSYLGDTSPIYEVYGGNRSAANPLALGTTIMTLNRDAYGVGGMLINDNVSRTYGTAANGMIGVGSNGGVIAATRFTTLTVTQPFALGANELIIGSPETVDWVSEPKLGTVLLSAGAGYSTAANGSKISILPGAQLNNTANSLPDLAEVAVGGTFYVAGSDTIGALSGTGLVSLANSVNLSVGRNDANTTFSGILINGNASCDFIKTGTGRLDLTADQSTFTGTVIVNGGELALRGGGKLNQTGTSAFTLPSGGVLNLDNSDVNEGNRLTGAAPGITFQGGTFRFTGKDGEASSESLGVAIFPLGSSTIDMINGSGAGSSSEVTFSALTANPVGTVNFTASNGTLGLAGDNPRVKFTSGVAVGLMGYATVGSAPAFYDTTYGVRAFDSSEGTEFNGTVNQTGINTLFTSVNAQPTLTASRTVQSIWIDAPGSGKFIELGTGNLNLVLSSGRLLLTGTDDFEIKRSGTGSLTGTPTYLYLGVDDPSTTLTLSVPAGKPIEKDGAGTLVFNAANTFTTGLNINNGTVKYGPSGDLAVTTLTTLNSGLFDMTGKTDTLGVITLYAGGITNSEAGGTLTIGTMAMGSGPAGSSARVDTGSGTLKLGGTVTYSTANDPNTATISGNLDLNGATRTFVVNNSVGAGADIDLDVLAILAGGTGFGVTKTGAGTMRLGGANTFDGPVNITGTLRLSDPQALGIPSAARALTVNAFSSLVFDGVNGNINVPANYTTLSLNGTGDTLLGPISGALVNGSGNNSISSPITLAAATTLASLSDKLTLTSGISGAFALTTAGDGDLQINGAIATGSGTLVKNGAGTLTLKGANTFTGAIGIYGGAVNVQNNTGLGTTAGLTTVYIGGELQLQNGIAIGAEALILNGKGSANGGALRNISGNNSYAGAITLAMPGVRINSDAGLLTLDVASGSSIAGTAFNVIFGGAGDITVADPIVTTTGTLTKDGSGTLTLGGVNTFTGTTTIEGGTLNVNGSLHASSAVTVKSGGALGGTGSCLGAATIMSGGTVAPGVKGTAGGTLTVPTLTLNAGSTCRFEFSGAPANDKVVVSGSGGLAIAPGTSIALYAAGTSNTWATLGTYSLIQYVGTLNGGVENLLIGNPHDDLIYTFILENNWIKVRVEPLKVAALAASDLTLSSARMNGLLVDVVADDPAVYFCWDISDKGTSATSNWAHVESVGVIGKGQPFSLVVSGLLSGSNYTYRCFAENSIGAAWSPEAVSFKPVYLPTVINSGALSVSLGVALLRGEVTDIGSEAPTVSFLYWKTGDTVTNTVNVGPQAAACSTQVSGLLLGVNYSYRLLASNLAGEVYSGVTNFKASGTYYVSPDGNDANDGLSWAQALLTIPEAVGRTQDHDVVLVTNGVYKTTAQILLDKGVTLQSVNGAAYTVLERTNVLARLVQLKHVDAVVDGFTITKSTYGAVHIDLSGTLINCIVSDNTTVNNTIDGAGVYLEKGGIVKNCQIINNNATSSSGGGQKGGGVYMNAGGLMDSCVISNNTSASGRGSIAGGVYMTGASSTLRNSLISQNFSQINSGGVYCNGGTIESCTIVDNYTPNVAGVSGLYNSNGKISNTIIAYNNNVNGLANYVNVGSTWTYDNTCTTPMVTGVGAGVGNTDLAPQFVDRTTQDYRLLAGPCVDTGVNQGWMTSAVDLAGNARIISATVDMGAFESIPGALRVGFEGIPTEGFASNRVVFLAFANGTNTTGLTYQWSFNNNATLDIEGAGRSVVTNLYWPGLYSVRLTVSNAAGETATIVREQYIKVAPETAYVSTTGASIYPYESWVNAATNIQDAINAGLDGTRVLVNDGVYGITSRIAMPRNITLRSVNGAEKTEVRRASGTTGIFYLTAPEAVVDGFTIANANVEAVYFDRGGVVSNCVIRDNFVGDSGGSGGGVRMDSSGLLKNCFVINNKRNSSGGGGANGCGIYMSGVAVVDSCIITNNSNGPLTGSTGAGGGVYMYNGGTLRNSLIFGNRHGVTAGGVYITGGGTIESCTIVSNSVPGTGVGGLYNSGRTIQNSIIQFNTSSTGLSNYGNLGAATYNNCSIDPIAGLTGSANIDTDPLFRNLAAGNCRLKEASPCINAGLYQPWMTGVLDVGGEPRILNRIVDIGAYEGHFPLPTAIMIR